MAAASLSACGGSGKPSYCSSVNDLKKSIKDLSSTNVLSNGVSSLEAALTTIVSNAEKAVSDAKSAFPSETSAVKSSVDALSSSVKNISGTPTAANIVTIGQQVSAVVSSIDSFTKAASSKCG
jgi:hypothetical protein